MNNREGLRRQLAGLRRSFSIMLGFPSAFASMDQERIFLASYATTCVAYRRASILLGLFTWIAFFGWDFYHGLTNPEFHTAMPIILRLRLTGTFVMLLVALGMFSRKGEDEHSASIIITSGSVSAFILLLGMSYVAPFPYNYSFYFIGLLLIILFVSGLFKMRVRPYLCFVILSLLSSAIVFAHAESDSLRFGAAGRYYYIAALTFLVSFFFTAYASVVQQERAAREAFAREQQIQGAKDDLQKTNLELAAVNISLVASERETQTRTEAIVKLKEDLRSLAERQNSSKSKFLADASHDLRQPLQALSNFLAAARHALDHGNHAQCSEFLMMAASARDLTSSLFGAILDISQLEAGTLKPAYNKFDLDVLVREVVRNLVSIAEAADTTLHVRHSAKSAWVRSDQHLLARLLLNLAGNGIKYRDPQKGGRSKVLIAIVAFPTHVRLDVIDNGLGIAKQHWPEIFKPFRQLHNPGRDREKGVGLGLSIVNAIVGALAGHRLEMSSHLGKGTRFSISIPLEDVIKDQPETSLGLACVEPNAI